MAMDDAYEADTYEDDTYEPDYPEYTAEYYYLDDGGIGRVWYDVDADAYIDAEIMNEYGQWTESSPEEVMSHGDEVSFSDAAERVAELGGTL